MFLDDRLHIAPVDQSHRDEENPIGLAGLEYGDDICVVDRGRHTGLPDEPLTERLIAGKTGRKNLQCDIPPELLIVGTVDDGHTSSAEDLADPVPGYAFPQAELAGCRRFVVHHASPLSPSAESLVPLFACLALRCAAASFASSRAAMVSW